jgi:hypothetical protein
LCMCVHRKITYPGDVKCAAMCIGKTVPATRLGLYVSSFRILCGKFVERETR